MLLGLVPNKAGNETRRASSNLKQLGCCPIHITQLRYTCQFLLQPQQLLVYTAGDLLQGGCYRVHAFAQAPSDMSCVMTGATVSCAQLLDADKLFVYSNGTSNIVAQLTADSSHKGIHKWAQLCIGRFGKIMQQWLRSRRCSSAFTLDCNIKYL